VVFGERHLRHVLLSYMDYHNGARSHLSLNEDAPLSRATEAAGRILSPSDPGWTASPNMLAVGTTVLRREARLGSCAGLEGELGPTQEQRLLLHFGGPT
jgi:hypothetical protein